MFANRPALGDFKENVMTLAPGKTISGCSQKGLKSRSVNSFSDSNLIPTKKPASGLKTASCTTVVSAEKENSKPKFKEPAIKAKDNSEEDSWPEIEKMHICTEPDDDYEDILPKHERLQKKDLNSFFNYSDANFYDSFDFIELTVDKPPSPLKECATPDIDIFLPELEIKASFSSLYDDIELEYIALQDEFLNY